MQNANIDYESKKITAQLVPQLYVGADHEEIIEAQGIPFDATRAVLQMPLGSIQSINNGSLTYPEVDALLPTHALNDAPGQPVRVTNLDSSTLEFFGVKDAESITQNMLDDAKMAHRITQAESLKMEGGM